MAALVLSVAGAAAGGALFGPLGAFSGRIVGALAGNVIDHALFASHQHREAQGPRLGDLDVMASTQGAPIPRVYGRLRLSGQMIWATRLEEVVTTRSETSGGGGKGMGGSSNTVTTTTTTYSYFANVAVGLCEGQIGRIGRVWADGKPLDISRLTVRAYTGSDTQDPDPLIVAKEGADNAPAYRGLAYVVFERLPLADFGNRIPQLSFEIIRPVGRLERMIRAVTLIPGTTEFGYETATVVRWLGPGQSAPENRHVTTHVSDVEASLDELQAVCPNLQRVAIVVAWFGTDLRANHCQVLPGVDSATKATFGATWSVAGLSREGAHLVSTSEGRPAYGGTPSDQSVRDLIAEVKARGLAVTLYPLVMMDIAADNTRPDPWSEATSQPAYPWRGRLTCDPAPGRPGSPDATPAAAAQIDAFFGNDTPGEWTYRRMVRHYASLALEAGGVDAFVIGSELKGLTRVRAAAGVYPAVDRLATLAADVKAIVGSGPRITYAADWTEYGAHVVDADEVRFPLDTLWASSAIDAVGVDYYAPLSDWRDGPDHLDRALADTIDDPAYLAANLRGGEAYAWYYASPQARAAQTRTPITDGVGKPWMFRAKDLWSWWSNPHVERVSGAELASSTAWVPQSKPIWLTEVGCPAVDKGANQPSTFPDAKSSDGGVPHHSNGWRDDLIQRRYLESVIAAFDPDLGASAADNPTSSVYGGPMVDVTSTTAWTWDARPYPWFPAATEIWSDGVNWATGHWLNGRLGTAPMADLIGAMAADAGIDHIDASALREGPDGYVIDRPMTLRAAIEPLALAYAFDAAEIDGAIRFRSRGGAPTAEVVEDDLVLEDAKATAQLIRAQETELPREVSLSYTDLASDYRRGAVASRRLVGASARASHADLAVVSNGAAMARRADIWLQDVWAGRESITFRLPPKAVACTPGDVLAVTIGGRRRLIEIQEIVDTDVREIRGRAIDPEIFDLPVAPQTMVAPAAPPSVAPVQVHLLDLPTLAGEDPPILTRVAVFADPWPGAVTIWRSDDALSFSQTAVALAPAIVGETLDPLPKGPTSRWDPAGRFRVKLFGGALSSVSDVALLGGGNVAAVKGSTPDWEVLQFGTAELVGERTYALSRLLRGQAGTEQAMGDPLPVGAAFVLLDAQVLPLARGLDALGRTMQLRLVASDRNHGDPAVTACTVTPGPTALRPLSPVHMRGRRTADGVVISFIRRTRREGDSWAAQEVPLAEDSEAYVLDILSGTTVVRSIEGAQPSILYPAARELADFGAPQTSLSVRITQLSATVGRGFAAAAILTV